MLVPELPSNISFPEYKFQASLESLYSETNALHYSYTELIKNINSNNINSQERRQTMINTTSTHIQISKSWTQPQTLSWYDLSIFKAT